MCAISVYSGTTEAEFIETPIFTEDVTELLADDEYRELQSYLMQHPTAGALIPGGGGLRKLRWAAPGKGKGKRGGHRVIYYWQAKERQFWMLLMFGKQRQEDLTANQKRALSAYIRKAKRAKP